MCKYSKVSQKTCFCVHTYYAIMKIYIWVGPYSDTIFVAKVLSYYGRLRNIVCHVIIYAVPVFSSWKEVIDMAKHKKERRRRCRPGNNRHHIFFEKKKWLSSGFWAAELRQCQWCIVEIDFGLHDHVTLNSPPVPIPSDETIEQVLYLLGRLVKHGSLDKRTSLERRLEILVYLFEGAAPDTAEALQAQLDAVREYYAGSLG